MSHRQVEIHEYTVVLQLLVNSKPWTIRCKPWHPEVLGQ